MITIFKINNHLLPEFLLNKISQNKETHNYNLRDPFKFKINRCRTHKTYNTIFFRGMSMYMLPLQLKECNNLLGFIVHLRQYFKENIVMC
jgi:hypothetical protein